MDSVEKKILDNYFSLLERLNPKMKLNLIERLTASVKSYISPVSKIQSSFGAWNSDESAKELIELIRSNRNTNRQIEKL